MAQRICPVVLGVFDTRSQAERAETQLHAAGFRFDEVEITSGPTGPSPTGLGASTGALTGSTGTDADAGVWLADLIGQGVSEDELRFYEQEFRAGRTLVIVRSAGREAEARTILHSYGGYDAGLLRCRA